MIAALLPWLVVLVAAATVVQLAVTAHRASRGTAPVDRHQLLARTLGSLTFVLLALVLGPWGPSTRLLWGVLVAGWAWGALTAVPVWRRPAASSAGTGGRRRATAGLLGEVGLLAAVIAFVVL